MATTSPAGRSQGQAASNENTPSFSSLGIKNSSIHSIPGVELTAQQKLLVGSVLDLFEGNPTLKHFSLWSKNATFADPLTVATGYAKYTAQFYGLPVLFQPIQLQSYRVTSAGNPIELEMSNKYTVKGIKKDQVMDSVVRIHVGQDGKIEKLEDRWNGNLPDGAVSDVSTNNDHGARRQTPPGRGWSLSPTAWVRWAFRTGGEAAWWGFCTLSWWSPFLAFRKLNAVTVPTLVKVPKTEEDDMKMKADREAQSAST